MRKHILPSIFFLILACACPLGAYASGEVYSVWDGTAKTAVTPISDVYTINTADELAWIASQNDDYAGKTITLAANIDLNNKVWPSIGTAAKPFKGTFNGNGHLLKGIRSFAGDGDGIGLFGHVAQEGKIESLGISGGQIMAKAKGRRQIGAIAGVCDGTISQCWSMAQIVASGNITGGLVGELREHGSLTDCYHVGIFLNGTDTMGCIVGLNNGGTLRRVYNAGYARRGMALVGVDKNGNYDACYTDRKLYYQPSGAVSEGIIPMDETEKMFVLFQDNTTWSLGSNRYPVLKAFENTDAAKLSAAPIFVNKENKDTIDHANDLLKDFTVSVSGGISWKCQNANDEEWIRINGSNVKVVRPCTETEVLVDVTLGDEKRVAYLRPRRLEDFESGSFDGPQLPEGVIREFCFEEEVLLSANISENKPAKNGWKENPATNEYYHYRFSLYGYNQNTKEAEFIEDLKDDITTPAYKNWYDAAKVPTDSAGVFVIRRFANDQHCVTDWKRSEGQFVYRVFEEFDPGEIEDNTNGKIDTFYLTSPVIISVDTISSAHGGGGPITYTWRDNGSSIGVNDTILKNYEIKKSGVHVFTRMAQDSAECCGNNNISKGQYTVVVFDPVDPGEITKKSDTVAFCSPEEAQAYTIPATAAKGGSGKYIYQWYELTADGDTVLLSGEDAQKQNLALNGMTFEYNKNYTYVRRVKDDTRFTTLDTEASWTKYQLTVRIRSEVDPGSIEDGELDNFCVATDNIRVKVNEIEPATSGDELEYQWLRIEVGTTDTTVVGNEANLDRIFDPELLENTYTYVRQVRNKGCQIWLESKGKATQYYDSYLKTAVSFVICDTELPYEIKWVDGKTYTFYQDGDSKTLTDTRGKCPVDTTFTIEVAEKPEFNFAEEANLCQEANTIRIEYDKTAGKTDTFHITYSQDLARYMGRPDTSGITDTEGYILIQNVPYIGTGDLHLFLELGYQGGADRGICMSKSRAMKLNINLGGYVYSKYDRVLFVDNNPKNGLLPDIAEKLEFVSYQWYKDGIMQVGDTGQYYHEGGKQLNGVYYVMLTDTKGNRYRSCEVTMPQGASNSAPQHSAVYPIPVGAGEQITIECEGEARIVSFTGEMIMQTAYIDGKTTIRAPHTTGMYYIQISDMNGKTEIHKLIVK